MLIRTATRNRLMDLHFAVTHCYEICLLMYNSMKPNTINSKYSVTNKWVNKYNITETVCTNSLQINTFLQPTHTHTHTHTHDVCKMTVVTSNNRNGRHTGVTTAQQTPQCGGPRGQGGPLPLGKRNCSTRPYQCRSFNPYPNVHVHNCTKDVAGRAGCFLQGAGGGGRI